MFGKPKSDKEALADLMAKLSQFASETSGAIAELDLNPVIVHEDGEGVTIADALIITGLGKSD